MEKVDFKRELKHLYNPSAKEVAIADIPEMNFIMIDGTGNPNTAASYQEAVSALFSVSYTLKFMIKKSAEVDYGVMPLEGLWWTDDMAQFNVNNKDIWKWTSMIMQPKYVTEDLYLQAIEQVKKKKLPALSNLRFESLCEGLAAQILHIGPFSDEGPTVERVHAFISDNGYEMSGKHHEIYLTDFQRTAPEKMKTIIRQPIRKK